LIRKRAWKFIHRTCIILVFYNLYYREMSDIRWYDCKFSCLKIFVKFFFFPFKHYEVLTKAYCRIFEDRFLRYWSFYFYIKSRNLADSSQNFFAITPVNLTKDNEVLFFFCVVIRTTETAQRRFVQILRISAPPFHRCLKILLLREKRRYEIKTISWTFLSSGSNKS